MVESLLCFVLREVGDCETGLFLNSDCFRIPVEILGTHGNY